MEPNTCCTILKPDNDLKEYRFVELPNKIQAFLISTKKYLEHFKLTSNENHTRKLSVQESLDEEYHKKDLNEEGDEPDYNDEEEETDMDIEGGDQREEFDQEENRNTKKNKVGLATCSISVFAGSCNDPADIQGLAHLLEHVIFLGSKEFPEPESYSKFISRHGGYENAYTSFNSTTYEFDIDNAYLGEALYRLSRLLKEPILGSEGIDKEVEAIDNEFELAAVDEDIQRFQTILNSFSPGFPLRNFGWGNKRTLAHDRELLHKEVRNFYESLYNSDKIKICIQANYDLDELEEIIKKSFSDFEFKLLKNVKEVTPEEIAQAQKSFPGCYFMKTTSQIQKLTFTWAVESLAKEFEVFPLDLILDILSEKGPGSLSYLLKEHNFITDLAAEINNIDGQENDYLYLPWLTIKLTDHGLANVGKVIAYVGQYLNMINSVPIPDYYWKESMLMSQLEFKYADEIPEDQLTSIVSHAMKYVPKERILEAGVFRVPKKEDKELVTRLLKGFTLTNTRIDIQAPEIPEHLFQYKYNKEVDYEFKEPHFGVKYTALNLKELVGNDYAQIEQGFYIQEFRYPEKNILIPDSAELLELNKDYLIPRELAEDQNKIQIWYSMEPNYRIPKAHVSMMLFFNVEKTSKMNSYLELLDAYLKDEFVKDVGNQARKAGFECSFSKHEYCCLEIHIYGFSAKIIILCKMILDFFYKCLKNLQESVFNLVKEKRIKHYERAMDDTDNYLKMTLANALYDFAWMPEQKKNFFSNECNFEEFKQLCSELAHAQAIRRIKLFTHGNLSMEDINILSEKIQSEIKSAAQGVEISNFKFVNPEAKVQGKLRKISPSNEVPSVQMMSHMKDNKSSMVMFFVELSEDSLKNRVLCQLLNQIFNNEIFEELRMRQEIGYVSNSYYITFPNATVGLEIWVSSSKINCQEITIRIREFIENFLGVYLEKYSDKEFEDLKNSEMSIKMKPFQNIQETAEYYWSEIKHNIYLLNRRKEEIEFLEKLESKEFKDWIRTGFSKKQWFSLELEAQKEESDSQGCEKNLENLHKLVSNYKEFHEYTI